MSSSWDCSAGPDPMADHDAPCRCESCHTPLFHGEPRIVMPDGLVYCSGPCALEGDES